MVVFNLKFVLFPWIQGDKNHDVWVFALAVLLSSTLVYNSIGKIDQDALDDLQ